jgi:hypothetical protein
VSVSVGPDGGARHVAVLAVFDAVELVALATYTAAHIPAAIR